MRHYTSNSKWLLWFAPFRGLPISAAYITPFFLEQGLNQTQILVLQAIFSITVVLWEVPSGWLADHFGRARCIKISGPIAAASLIAYGFSDTFWQFLLWEVMLAVANGLISGADDALLMDSLKADGREAEFAEKIRHINSIGYASTTIGVPVSFLMVSRLGISATIVADGLLILVGMIFALRLVEAPGFCNRGGKASIKTAAQEFKAETGGSLRILREEQTKYLVILFTVFAISTLFGYWLSAPLYAEVGIPVRYFALILATRSGLKFWLSYRFRKSHVSSKGYAIFASLDLMVYLAMATLSPWLVFMVIGHDVIQAVCTPTLSARLNEHFESHERATMNSAANMIGRLSFAMMAPLVGLLVDQAGLRTAFMFLGLTTVSIALVALTKAAQGNHL